MKILVIGSGGREHALVWKLAQSTHSKQMWCAPGNAGISKERLSANDSWVQCVPINAEDLPRLLAFAEEKRPDLSVVGPDNPLALGIVDLFQQKGLRIWGPNKQAAQFEASKAFAQEFMERWGIPTARSGVFDEPSKAKHFAAELDGRCAVKADGLALGKGVLICHSVEAANRAIDGMLIEEAFGTAGSRIVVQELLEGIELSLHAICDGTRAELFPTSQDHKRALDGDLGLNTGGMGAYSPAPFLDEKQLGKIHQTILEPWLRGCTAEGIDFRGILYPGIMLTSKGPKVLEFNARFGDPETQVYMTRLETDLVELLDASLEGRLDRMTIRWSPMVSACIVMASGGYPGTYSKGKVIRGLDKIQNGNQVKVFHAGTACLGEEIVTSGGRVLGVTAWEADLRGACSKAYETVRQIEFEGAHFRRDIAAKAL
jgi:phosphoribosylamine---glycine ligase